MPLCAGRPWCYPGSLIGYLRDFMQHTMEVQIFPGMDSRGSSRPYSFALNAIWRESNNSLRNSTLKHMSGYQWVEGSSSLYGPIELTDNSVVRNSLHKRILTPGLKVRAKRESSPFPRPWSPRLLRQSACWLQISLHLDIKTIASTFPFPILLVLLPNSWSQLQPYSLL